MSMTKIPTYDEVIIKNYDTEFLTELLEHIFRNLPDMMITVENFGFEDRSLATNDLTAFAVQEDSRIFPSRSRYHSGCLDCVFEG